MVTFIAFGLAGGFLFLFIRQIKRTAEKSKEFEIKEKEYRSAIADLNSEVKRRDHIIHAIEEVNRETAEKKREIRNSTDPARAATDVMRELAAGDGKGDGSPPGS